MNSTTDFSPAHFSDEQCSVNSSPEFGCYSDRPMFCYSTPAHYLLDWAHLAHQDVTIIPPKDSTSPSNARSAYPFGTFTPGSASLQHVCVAPCRRMCMPCRDHDGSTHMHTTYPRSCPHVPVKPRESALIPNVTSSPDIHGPSPLFLGVVRPA